MRARARENRKRKRKLTQKSQQTTQRSFNSRIRSTDRQRPRHRITTRKRSSNNRQQSHIKAQIKSIHSASKEFPRRHDARVRDDVMVCHGVDGGTRSSLVIWWSGNISTLSSYIFHLSHSVLYAMRVIGVGWLGWSCYVLGPGGSQGYFSNVSRGNVPMGPTKLPNPKSLRPLVVPKRQRERSYQHCLVKCADTSHLCLATERERHSI